jgi:hypothetical protein
MSRDITCDHPDITYSLFVHLLPNAPADEPPASRHEMGRLTGLYRCYDNRLDSPTSPCRADVEAAISPPGECGVCSITVMIITVSKMLP